MRRAHKTRCSKCRQLKPDYDIVGLISEGKASRNLCSRCFNTESAERYGLGEFQHADFDPVTIRDCSGEAHVFHFRAWLFMPYLTIDAFELHKGRARGYRFKILGDPEEDDLLVLLGRLIEKIRRALAVKHLKHGAYGWAIGDAQIVRGRIDWDEEEHGGVPLLVIDGREVTWEQFGRMMMTYEGWEFRLQINDPGEDAL